MLQKLYFLILLIIPVCIYPTGNYGKQQLINFEELPILNKDTRINYTGSIDKEGKNADWDWWLYQDDNQEWVLFDVYGSGCIYNFVQHRYIASEEPIFKFYFDGEETPRFTIKPSEFGEKYPFTEPLAAKYIGPVENGRGPIRVIRSFVPMPFEKSCKITSNIKLEGFDKSLGHGGWGHVVYHLYSSDKQIKSFNPDTDFTSVTQKWKNVGTDPKNQINSKKYIQHNLEMPPNTSQAVLNLNSLKGYISSIRIKIDNMQKSFLEDLWIKASWDNHDVPDVYCPIGCFFGNSLGYNNTNYLLMGNNTEGEFYNFFPMPFWEEATIKLENKGNETVNIQSVEIQYNENPYEKTNTGYFRSSDYYERKHTPNADSKIAHIKGFGKMVAAHITCFGEINTITCEGDVRVYIDGNKTPQVQSDGSESYICYGWGFPTPAEMHPSGGYDGLSDNPWSMTRLCMGDYYPFYKDLVFGIESGENNNQYLEHSGCIFYYGQTETSMILTDSLDLSDNKSIKKHKYKTKGKVKKTTLNSFFEGNYDHVLVIGKVFYFDKESSFNVNIDPNNQGIKIRRRSDQIKGRQYAKVFIDGEEVTEYPWYYADKNPYKRWLEDDFEIPSKYTKSKKKINIRIVPTSLTQNPISWNESQYKIYSKL